MNKIHICKSCGKVMKNSEDFAGGDMKSQYCKECADEFGHRKRFSHIIEESKELIIKNLSLSQAEAEKMAEENISRVPFWVKRQKFMNQAKNILITDIGSTTTKAVLLAKKQGVYKIVGLNDASTTVEKPHEDVKIGIFNVVKGLEEKTGLKLLKKGSGYNKLIFDDSLTYLSTSSAGGGLQILVIGLTMFDSASSGKRAAFGAGGVILDTFAIDDKRTTLQQMQEMKILHPDIILMAGGVDGGAIAPLLRLGEILQIANPKPKFGEKDVIPLIFAGNVGARNFISGLFKERFQLYIVPNIRPTMTEENLDPARAKIHKLFMDNVMEQAPGYSQVKKSTTDDIIPTPLGVITSLQLISENLNKNVMSVDIGGATTDVFSNILGEYFRTVSANYGMSYSISNVMKDAGIEKVISWLPEQFNNDFIRNYVCNKMLYPVHLPQDQNQLAIEQAIAREAIKMSKQQHFKMNFNKRDIGFLDKLKQNHRDLEKITEAFYIEKTREKKRFHMHDINLLIGAGGSISHTKQQEQALAIIYDGFLPQGITEIWRDKDFITPHLGKLSALDEKLASEILSKSCFEKLALTIRPITKKWRSNELVMTVDFTDDESRETAKVMSGNLFYWKNHDNKTKTYRLNLKKGYYLNDDNREYTIKTDCHLLIDTRMEQDFKSENEILKLYDFPSQPPKIEEIFKPYLKNKNIESGSHKHLVELPYPGEIRVKPGDEVEPGSVIGINLYDPPKLYVISLFDKKYLKLNPENFADSLIVKEGDEIKNGQRIVEIGNRSFIDEIQFQHFYYESPIRGRIEKINYDSGTIILREIQDYSSKPKTINVAKKLNINPKNTLRYLKKGLNDFIYAGDCLARRIADSKYPIMVWAPTTGTIKNIDSEAGTVTIQYDKKPYRKLAGIKGKVTTVNENYSAEIQYSGVLLPGIIGFGSEAAGKLRFLGKPENISSCESGDIVVFPGKIDLNLLKAAEKSGVSGFVAASIDNKDLIEFIGEEIGVALTGNEKIPYPLILTEGFGDFRMQSEYFDFFREHDRNWIFIDGHTQIRAGVIRPKIIVQDL